MLVSNKSFAALGAVLLCAACAPGSGYGGYSGYSSSLPQGSGLGGFGVSKGVIGGAAGAAGGGFVGSHIGKGSGNLAATAAGTLLGAFLGYGVGVSLDRVDQMYAQQATLQSLSTGQAVQWQGQQADGMVVPGRVGYQSTPYGQTACREYRHIVHIGGRKTEAYGQACQQADGSWRIGG